MNERTCLCGMVGVTLLSLVIALTPSARADETETETESAAAVAASAESHGFVFLPSRPLYEPLIADPQWPRFAVAYQRYLDDPELGNVGNVAFGGMLPVVQGDLPGEGRWELGVQAGVFSIFDLDGDSFDLINTDFWVGLPFSVRWGRFSSILRVYHQSSHLGDEFLLRSNVDRVNLSYEAVDLIPSLDLWDWGRAYLGGGYLFNRNPDELKRKYVLAGAEIKSPVAFWGWLRPIAAGDVHRREEQDWRSDYSAKLGFQFENEVFHSRRLLLLAEYYKGRSPNLSLIHISEPTRH